ncbi:hypothetical protein WKK05_14405 [Nostoc sp. UHCC 0302]|uniref:hypothetical protein n=1 Tax=Nostoc sp. UHCC 0302 TaxID=3134896 RepID=UPI00311C9B01
MWRRINGNDRGLALRLPLALAKPITAITISLQQRCLESNSKEKILEHLMLLQQHSGQQYRGTQVESAMLALVAVTTPSSLPRLLCVVVSKGGRGRIGGDTAIIIDFATPASPSSPDPNSSPAPESSTYTAILGW